MYENQMFAGLKPKVTIKYNTIENIKAFKNTDKVEDIVSETQIAVYEYVTFVFNKNDLGTLRMNLGDIIVNDTEEYIVRRFKKFGIDGTYVKVFCTTE